MWGHQPLKISWIYEIPLYCQHSSLLSLLISWKRFSAQHVRVHPPPPVSHPWPLGEIENSTPLIIMYEEITLRPERKIASGSSYALCGNYKDDVERGRKERRGEWWREDIKEGEMSSDSEEGRQRRCGAIMTRTTVRDQKVISGSDSESSRSLRNFTVGRRYQSRRERQHRWMGG